MLVAILAIFLIMLIARSIIGFVITLGRYRPHGGMAALFEVVFSATDPIMRPLEKALPPIRGFSIAFPIAWIGTLILINVARGI